MESCLSLRDRSTALSCRKNPVLLTHTLNKSREISFLRLEELPGAHPVSRFALYWQQLSALWELPYRDSFDPMQVPRVLPWLAILARQHDHRRTVTYRYRLVGDEFSSLLGQYPVGKSLEDVVSPENLEQCIALSEQTLNQAEPIYYMSTVPINERSFIEVYVGLFPFREQPNDQIFLVAAPKTTSLAGG